MNVTYEELAKYFKSNEITINYAKVADRLQKENNELREKYLHLSSARVLDKSKPITINDIALEALKEFKEASDKHGKGEGDSMHEWALGAYDKCQCHACRAITLFAKWKGKIEL